MKYLAIKIKSFNHWIWFKKENVAEDSITGFSGKGGWGKDGAMTDVSIPINLIEGRIESNELQYNKTFQPCKRLIIQLQFGQSLLSVLSQPLPLVCGGKEEEIRKMKNGLSKTIFFD